MLASFILRPVIVEAVGRAGLEYTKSVCNENGEGNDSICWLWFHRLDLEAYDKNNFENFVEFVVRNVRIIEMRTHAKSPWNIV